MKALLATLAAMISLLDGTTWTQQPAAPLAGKPTLYLIGDSTVKVGTAGQVGWGERLADYFDPSRIAVVNAARGGRSSRTYLTEGLWARVVADLKRGDFVMMQFGHNDGSPLFTSDRPRGSIKGTGDDTQGGTIELTGRDEIVHTYGWYLRRYVSDTRSAGAAAIVCSLIPRNAWREGRVVREDYARWSRDVAEVERVPFIDLNDIVARRYERLGPEQVGRLFPNDHTHTNLQGADINAESVIAGLKTLPDCRLCQYMSEKAAAIAPAAPAAER